MMLCGLLVQPPLIKMYFFLFKTSKQAWQPPKTFILKTKLYSYVGCRLLTRKCHRTFFQAFFARLAARLLRITFQTNLSQQILCNLLPYEVIWRKTTWPFQLLLQLFLYFALKLQQNEVKQVRNKSEKIVKYHSQQIVMRQNVTDSKNCWKQNPESHAMRVSVSQQTLWSVFWIHTSYKNLEKRAINAIFFK